MTDFIQSQIKEVNRWICSYCDGEIYMCDDCKDRFETIDIPIYCFADGRHLCRVCCEDFEEEKENELNQKQQLKQEEI